MKEYRHFTGVENRYVMKRRYGFALVIAIGLALCGIGCYMTDNITIMWIFALLAVLCLVSIWLESLVIDLTEEKIILKRGLIGRETVIPLVDIRHFEMVKMSQYLITTNTSLNLWYVRNGKEKVAMISNGFTTRGMQRVLNEMDEIIQDARR